MAHCPPEWLDDLHDVFAEVRTWNGVVEKKPGVFYLGSQPFLHFHLFAEQRRRADVKDQDDWLQIELPHPASTSTRRKLLRELRRHYERKRIRRSGA